ncbi:MAG: hypothetical protein AB8F95_15850 [Bacteroidia bacterium]
MLPSFSALTFSYTLITFCVVFSLTGCSGDLQGSPESQQAPIYSSEITEYTDKAYPDNPDISIRRSKDGLLSHQKVLFKKHEVAGVFPLLSTPRNDVSDAIIFPKDK